ncbi:MAG: glycosyltransferase [Candidatus Bathyarchaeia archaeon]
MVVAFSVPYSETMIGGYRIAIECTKRFIQKGLHVIFLTNEHGKKMFRRYIDAKEENFILSTWMPVKGKGAIVSFPIAACFYTLMTITGSYTVVRNLNNITSCKGKTHEKLMIYSTSPFITDIVPSLILRHRIKGSKMIVAMSMFSPPPLKGWRAFQEAKVGIPDIRAITHYVNQVCTYSLVKRFADGIYVNNDLDRHRAIIDGFKPSAVKILGMGVDNRLSNKIEAPGTKKYDCVFVGRLHPQKGVLEMLDIWKLFVEKNQRAKLAIIGNGPLESKMKRKVQQLRLKDNVEMFGFMDGEEKIKILKSSKVFLHPSLYDSGGMAALEGMSCGLPGISYDLPDLRVYYPQGMIKVPCYDHRKFAESIDKLINDHDLYRKLSNEAIQWAREHDWDKQADELLAFLEHI